MSLELQNIFETEERKSVYKYVNKEIYFSDEYVKWLEDKIIKKVYNSKHKKNTEVK